MEDFQSLPRPVKSRIMEYLNPVLLLILVSQICLGLCAWRSPRFLRRLAVYLLTRADVVDVSRAENVRRMKIWTDQIAPDSGSKSIKVPLQIPVHRFTRDEVEVS
jgi:hypothetical protein